MNRFAALIGALTTTIVIAGSSGFTAVAQTSTPDSPVAGLSPTAAETPNPFAGLAGTATTTAQSPGADAMEVCPAVQILAVQGTGESSASASITADSGMLGRLITPVLVENSDASAGKVARAYVPYDADFGFQGVPYSQSMTNGLANLTEMSTSIHTACPSARFIIAGYSQGADIADQFLRTIGQGRGPFSPELLAAGILFSSPTRQAGSGVFPGTDDTSPDPVPGTTGAAVTKVSMGDQPAPQGGGISPTARSAGDLGKVEGRVASFCVSGDLACDTPEGAPIARLVANIAGQTDLSDPIAALSSISTALANTAVKTTGSVVAEDISGQRLDTLDYSPTKSISQRLAEASDPRAPMPDPAQILNKLGAIAINTVAVIVKKVLTPSNIIQLATVGLANPGAALTMLGAKVLGAVGELVTPATANRMVTSAFKAVEQNIDDNKELGKLITDTRYWDAIRLHGSYGSTPVSPTGDSAIGVASEWMNAAISDVHETMPAPQTPTVPLTTATAPYTSVSFTTRSFTPTPAPLVQFNTSAATTSLSRPTDGDHK